MANKRELIEFVIAGNYSPETLPMARLAEYMGDLALVLGEKEKVHFLGVESGSAVLVSAVDDESVPKVREQVHAVRHGEGPEEARRAQERIDERLRRDNAEGFLRLVADRSHRLLHFPGATRPRQQAYGPFSQSGELSGVPISIGGREKLANVNLEDGERVHYCEASRDLAREIAQFLFRGHIRVQGMGVHYRDPDGKWEVRRFQINAFELLDEAPLSDTVERMRAITRRGGMQRDILTKLTALRED